MAERGIQSSPREIIKDISHGVNAKLWSHPPAPVFRQEDAGAGKRIKGSSVIGYQLSEKKGQRNRGSQEQKEISNIEH